MPMHVITESGEHFSESTDRHDHLGARVQTLIEQYVAGLRSRDIYSVADALERMAPIQSAINDWHQACCVRDNWQHMRRLAEWSGEGEPP